MREIVAITQDKEILKHGSWVMLDKILKIGAEVNFVKSNEPGNKLRIFKVVKRRGFSHQVSPFDKRSRVSSLLKGTQFFYMG